jgi:methylenetetrahydrofolate reductase (NADPH)
MVSAPDPVVDRFARFEVLPLGRSEQEAAQLPEPARLTVTCSPKHGPARSVEMARRLRAHGHAVTVHLAARMVRDHDHLDRLLTEMVDTGVDDVFVIGGDSPRPHGRYRSAVQILPEISAHPHRPHTIGIGVYPEGHPHIDDVTLADALEHKCPYADYMTSQLCFHADALLSWAEETRARGVTLPLIVGVPGVVDHRKLLEMSMRIGVGSSLSFLRKQRGFVRNLLGPSRHAADHLFDDLVPALADGRLGVTGFHYYTFNKLVDTWRWDREKRGGWTPAADRRAAGEEAAAAKAAL